MNALFAARLNHHPWHITPMAAQELVVMAETQITLDDFITPRQGMRVYGGVAFINVCGVLAGDMPGIWEKLGNTDYRTLTAELSAAKADATIRAAVLYVRSPGGNCAGCTEIYDLVSELADLKPVIAYTDSMMCSAAYYISSAATFIYASKTASVGSIGCIYTLCDASEALKAMGVRVFQLASGDLKGGSTQAGNSAAQIADIERVIGDYFEAFSSDVRKKRNIADDAMRGQWFKADKAPPGLVDFIGLPAVAAADALMLSGGDGTIMAPNVVGQFFGGGAPSATHGGGNPNHGKLGLFAHSETFDIKATGGTADGIRHGLAQSDKVHGVNERLRDLKTPITVGSSKLDPNEHGAYFGRTDGGGEVQVRPGTKLAALAAVHEAGHRIDHVGFGHQGLTPKGPRYATDTGDIAKLMDTVKSGKASTGLARMVKSAKGKTDYYSKGFRHFNKPNERFARAYSQYVAVRSGDPELKRQLEAHRKTPVFGKYLYHTDEEFGKVGKAFDKTFAEHKLR